MEIKALVVLCGPKYSIKKRPHCREAPVIEDVVKEKGIRGISVDI